MDEKIMVDIANVLKVPEDSIKNFDEKKEKLLVILQLPLITTLLVS
jgi:hypothetical protein